MKKRIRTALSWIGVVMFIGGAVVAVIQTSLLWGAVATVGMVVSAAFGSGDGTVDWQSYNYFN